MGKPLTDIGPILQFQCPHCGHLESDDYEVIDEAVPANWRCDECRLAFRVIVLPCANCAGETVLSQIPGADLPPWNELLCQQCGQHLRAYEESSQIKLFG